MIRKPGVTADVYVGGKKVGTTTLLHEEPEPTPIDAKAFMGAIRKAGEIVLQKFAEEK